MTVSTCHFCQNPTLKILLDFGNQAFGNRFLSSPEAEETTAPLSLGQCDTCGLVQLLQPAPPELLRPTLDWISYKEPEGHLGALVQELTQLPSIATDSRLGAIVFGSDTTMAYFESNGFSKSWRVDLARDFGVSDPTAGVETLQKELTPTAAERISKQHGKFDLLVVRHVLEHSHNLISFLKSIRLLVRPGGYVVIEVPDCEGPFVNCDYSIIWEEHTFYFSRETLCLCLEAHGFKLLKLEQPTYSLVAITQITDPLRSESALSEPLLNEERERMERFATSFPQQRQKISATLRQLSAREGKIAFFGAGHLACTYINLLELKRHIEFVVDDHPKKCGMFMPGSRLPILSSRSLVEHDIKICLSTLSPETEQKVADTHRGFVNTGGRFVSIFAERPNSLLI
jgi:SAM-dependent methyltransferase